MPALTAANRRIALHISTESVADLIAVLYLCQAFIGADAGAMHLAAGLACAL
jgi:ADP-heptose:LPS heptosyltransferase